MEYNVKVMPLEEPRNWKILEDIIFEGVLVPRGFHVDGASIPVGLRWLFPHGGRKFFAACIHDWLYRTGGSTRKEADGMFLRAMLENGVGKVRANTMYIAVRVFGSSSWKGGEEDG